MLYAPPPPIFLNSDNPNNVFSSGRKVDMAYTGEFPYALIIYIYNITESCKSGNTSLVNSNCIRVASSYETDSTRYFAVISLL